MPNHIHAIIEIGATTANVGAKHASPQTSGVPQTTGTSHMSASFPIDAGVPQMADDHASVIHLSSHGAKHASPLQVAGAPHKSGSKPQSLAAIVGAYKSSVTKQINQLRSTPGLSIWQRNYYERVIRNQHEYMGIAAYIANNPRQWATDELFEPHSRGR